MSETTSLADPAPLGLAGFGVTTVLLSLAHTGVFSEDLLMGVVPLALVYGGSIQIIAGILGYRNGDVFATTAFTSYGAFWWWFGIMTLLEKAHWLPQVGDAAVGAILLMWGVFSLYMWGPTFSMNWAFVWLLFTVWVTFGLLGFADLLGVPALEIWGGWVGVVCGFSALYISFAEIMNERLDSRFLPLGGTPVSG